MVSTPTGLGATLRIGAVVFVVTAIFMGITLAVTIGIGARSELGASASRLAQPLDRLAIQADSLDRGDRQNLVKRARLPVRLLDADGDVVASSPPTAPWSAGAAPAWLTLAGRGAEWRPLDGAVELGRPLSGGQRLQARGALPKGAASVAAEIRAGVPAALLVSLALATAAAVWSGRGLRRREAWVGAAEAIASGRAPAIPAARDVAHRRMARALGRIAERTADLEAAAEQRIDALAAMVQPLRLPAATRAAGGRGFRNDALERLHRELAPHDRDLVEQGIAEALAARGPSARRLGLSDDRVLELEAWQVPGGRLAIVCDRSEQERLAALRRQLVGAAARHLRTPIREIQASGAELASHIDGAGALALRRLVGAADRLDAHVGSLLRGTPHDEDSPPTRQALGPTGFAWAIARDWGERLRGRGVRLELEVSEDAPALLTDPAVAEQVIRELMANAEAFTPRGGTITLSVLPAAGDRVEIVVRDSGPGLSPADVPVARERFFRGAGSETVPGAGLGLGVAGALAERLGGQLTLEPGPGGCARLELPAARSGRSRAA